MSIGVVGEFSLRCSSWNGVGRAFQRLNGAEESVDADDGLQWKFSREAEANVMW